MAGLQEAQLQELAFQLLLATGERAPDAASAAAVQDRVRRALQARIAPRATGPPMTTRRWFHGKVTLSAS